MRTREGGVLRSCECTQNACHCLVLRRYLLSCSPELASSTEHLLRVTPAQASSSELLERACSAIQEHWPRPGQQRRLALFNHMDKTVEVVQLPMPSGSEPQHREGMGMGMGVPASTTEAAAATALLPAVHSAPSPSTQAASAEVLKAVTVTT